MFLTNNKSKELIVSEEKHNSVIKTSDGTLIQARQKQVKVNGKSYNVNCLQLMRMIKNVTQTIGEYKNKDNIYAEYVINSLRKARADMVSDLERHFNISWSINEETGKSTFLL